MQRKTSISIIWTCSFTSFLCVRMTRCQFHLRFKYKFYVRRSWKRQITLLTWLSFFAHSGCTSVKVVCRTLMKSIPGVHSILLSSMISTFVFYAKIQIKGPHKMMATSSEFFLKGLFGSIVDLLILRRKQLKFQ